MGKGPVKKLVCEHVIKSHVGMLIPNDMINVVQITLRWAFPNL